MPKRQSNVEYAEILMINFLNESFALESPPSLNIFNLNRCSTVYPTKPYYIVNYYLVTNNDKNEDS